jgi:hypothetical protein
MHSLGRLADSVSKPSKSDRGDRQADLLANGPLALGKPIRSDALEARWLPHEHRRPPARGQRAGERRRRILGIDAAAVALGIEIVGVVGADAPLTAVRPCPRREQLLAIDLRRRQPDVVR